MPAHGYPFQVVGGVPVVTAPAEIDNTTVNELQAILLEWHRRGDNTVVVDMSSTQFCDAEGLRELVLAHQRAVANGGGLKVVLPTSGSFLRSFTISRLDGIIPAFPTMEQALAHIPAATIYRRRRRRGTEPAATSPSSPAEPASSPAHVPETHPLVTDSRSCAKCGALFVPKREHARFCGCDCRAAWNREHLGDPAIEASALTWSMAALTEAMALLPVVGAWDESGAFAAIGEGVWWITMVDATLVRHHSEAYANVLSPRTVAERQFIDETLAGLRFVRNWMSRESGLRELVETGAGDRHVTRWTWKSFPAPGLAWLSPCARAWELSRYRAYQARLAGRTIGETLAQAVSFLTLVGSSAEPNTDGVGAPRLNVSISHGAR